LLKLADLRRQRRPIEFAASGAEHDLKEALGVGVIALR
jgi:hypothetical protein